MIIWILTFCIKFVRFLKFSADYFMGNLQVSREKTVLKNMPYFCRLVLVSYSQNKAMSLEIARANFRPLKIKLLNRQMFIWDLLMEDIITVYLFSTKHARILLYWESIK